jgi:hypothetical protein
MSKGETDVSVKENRTSINISFTGSFAIDFGYFDPLQYRDMIDFRTYLEMIAKTYNVIVTPTWRNIIEDNSYIMARDYNDTVKYCIALFTAIQKKYPRSFKGDIQAFKRLPTIQKNDDRGPHTYSARGNHFFPEWDDLIDALKLQSIVEEEDLITDVIKSMESATWSTAINTWESYNEPVKLLNSKSEVNQPNNNNSMRGGTIIAPTYPKLNLTASATRTQIGLDNYRLTVYYNASYTYSGSNSYECELWLEPDNNIWPKWFTGQQSYSGSYTFEYAGDADGVTITYKVGSHTINKYIHYSDMN